MFELIEKVDKFVAKASFICYGFFMSAALGVSGIAMPDELFKATRTGASPVPSVVTDTDGSLHVLVDAGETEIKLTIMVNEGVWVRQAHFQCAPEGSNGPVTAF